jgi:hypothetical protein
MEPWLRTAKQGKIKLPALNESEKMASTYIPYLKMDGLYKRFFCYDDF